MIEQVIVTNRGGISPESAELHTSSGLVFYPASGEWTHIQAVLAQLKTVTRAPEAPTPKLALVGDNVVEVKRRGRPRKNIEG